MSFCVAHRVNTTGTTSKLVTNFPLYFFQAYLALTVFVYAYGPWPWPTREPIMLYGFLFFVQAGLWFGYKSGLKGGAYRYTGRLTPFRIFNISLWVNAIWIGPSYILRTGSLSLDVAAVAQSIVMGLTDPGAMYAEKVEALASVEQTSSLGYITQLISPLLWPMVPLGVFLWRELPLFKKVAFVLIASLDLLSWVAIGTNKGLFDIFIIAFWVALARNTSLIRSITSPRAIKNLMLTSLAISALVLFFAIGQEGRSGGEARTFDRSANISLDLDNWMIASLPDSGKMAFGALASYLTQGYYPLSLSLPEEFTFSYGVGHSYYYTGILQSFLGQGVVSDLTYPAKIESYGWDRFEKWHSIYPWIASDLTFPGVIVFVFMIGRLTAKAWIESIVSKNPLAITLFSLLVIMLFYFPANNQVLAFSRTANAFWFVLLAWSLKRAPVKSC